MTDFRNFFFVFQSRYALVVDAAQLEEHETMAQRCKVKLDATGLQWTPHISTSMIELEERKIEGEVSLCVRLIFSYNFM